MFHLPFRRPAAAAATAAAAALATLALSTACAPSASVPAAPAPAATTTLLVRLGADTVSMEQYTRTPHHVDGIVVNRSPMTTVARYSVELGAGNAPQMVEYSIRRGDGSMASPGAMQSLSMRYGRDSVYVTGHRANGDTTRAIAARGELLPWAGGYGLFELALDKLAASGRDSTTFALVPMQFGVNSFIPSAFKLTGPGAARYDWFGYPVTIRHDGRANIQVVDGLASTIKVRVDRVASTDLAAIAREWTMHEQTAGAAGPTSTRDTVRAVVAGANLWIDYGRPSLRGRDVWTKGVLGDTLWRTGANAATQFRTDRDVMIGGTVVPAGTYTLWTAASPNGYHLAINKQFGQWGTEYDAKRDLARVPLRESAAAAPVERFTIAVDPQGMLVLSWGAKRLSVPVTAR